MKENIFKQWENSGKILAEMFRPKIAERFQKKLGFREKEHPLAIKK